MLNSSCPSPTRINTITTRVHVSSSMSMGYELPWFYLMSPKFYLIGVWDYVLCSVGSYKRTAATAATMAHILKD